MKIEKIRKVILDVDTGSDDAIALMAAIASDEIEVVAVCNVWGNLTVDKTTHNSLSVVKAMNAEIPVFEGCGGPMVKDLSKYRDLENDWKPLVVNGKELKIHYDRLEGLPEPDQVKEKDHAVKFYYDYLNRTEEKVSIIAVGPLTNLGFLFYLAPNLAEKVDRLIIMGGGVNISNCSKSGEANIWHDPEAFQIVLNAGLKPLVVPLDATYAASLNLSDCERLETLGTFPANFTARLIRERIEFELAQFGPNHAWSAIHDALALCAFLDSSVLINIISAACEVGFHEYSDGEILIDSRQEPLETNAEIALSADKTKFIDMLCDLFSIKQ